MKGHPTWNIYISLYCEQDTNVYCVKLMEFGGLSLLAPSMTLTNTGGK